MLGRAHHYLEKLYAQNLGKSNGHANVHTQANGKA